jgi:hypothetical protein
MQFPDDVQEDVLEIGRQKRAQMYDDEYQLTCRIDDVGDRRCWQSPSYPSHSLRHYGY